LVLFVGVVEVACSDGVFDLLRGDVDGDVDARVLILVRDALLDCFGLGLVFPAVGEGCKGLLMLGPEVRAWRKLFRGRLEWCALNTSIGALVRTRNPFGVPGVGIARADGNRAVESDDAWSFSPCDSKMAAMVSFVLARQSIRGGCENVRRESELVVADGCPLFAGRRFGQ